MSALTPDDTHGPQIASLLGDIGELIRQARQTVLRTVDTVQVQTYWQIGRHIVEFEQAGARRAGYGKQLQAKLAKTLTADFGKGFDASNLRYMRLFYQAFPICDALRHELSWVKALPSLPANSASAPTARTSTSIWCFTTTCSSALSFLISNVVSCPIRT